MLDPDQNYIRKSQVLYDSSGKSILKFIEKTPDRNDLTGELVKNMNSFIKCYPERVEIFKQEENLNVQLNLF